ncbi:hypothetical protein C5F48_19255 [Cereibacter changlensis JA139]|uniref:Uncharacterized protein n=1 Tax=Cereibacter changlensis JA139 TaxID=1188249 RepID=A0A2T4JQB7_9RHOB|nr:hypothetical protein C5F48_19255 [Cereibacter changlensis JA139]
MQAAFDDVMDAPEHTSVAFSHRLTLPDGATRWLSSHGELVRDHRDALPPRGRETARLSRQAHPDASAGACPERLLPGPRKGRRVSDGGGRAKAIVSAQDDRFPGGAAPAISRSTRRCAPAGAGRAAGRRPCLPSASGPRPPSGPARPASARRTAQAASRGCAACHRCRR